MPIYNLFISHSWAYSDAYDSLIKLLSSDSGFSYRNYSVPKDDPINDAKNSKELKDAIRNQMKYGSVIVILAGVYSTYSKWINIEIELAKEFPKPILAIEPWGAEKTSAAVKDAASEIVKWNTASIVSAIKRLGPVDE